MTLGAHGDRRRCSWPRYAGTGRQTMPLWRAPGRENVPQPVGQGTLEDRLRVGRFAPDRTEEKVRV
jgi:hypothetical protein